MRGLQYSVRLSASHSVTQQKSGSQRWQPHKDWNKNQNVALDILSPLNMPYFFCFNYFSRNNHKQWLEMPPKVTPYSCEQAISLLPVVVLHYTIFSVVYRSAWSFIFKLLVKWVPLVCLSFSYEDSINVYRFITRVAYWLAQALHIDLHELHIGIFTLMLLQINYSYGLCNS